MSDTPRTDEVAASDDGGNGYIANLTAIARQLERELNYARQIASKYEDRYFTTLDLLNASTSRAVRIKVWLRETNERVKRLESWCGGMAEMLTYEGWETTFQKEFEKYKETKS